ncbi:type I-E CRISPR-associated protein Cas6/Cse3/CasE [Streptomyces sp. NRRL S-481]|uniref:type I-E CRISPR-associated protein Cas6/Cse3/CasE n=1 Tax=Streptomyces sp. NRRL S-481 TaxID=1463911 RepID=UPI003B6369AE
MIDRPTCWNEQIRRLFKVLALVMPMFLPPSGGRNIGQRCERHGFSIPDATATPLVPGLQTEGDDLSAGPVVTIVSHDILRFRKRPDGPRVTLSTATFEGRLRVTDPDTLRASLLGGIGPAKGYGQGLLTLAPLHTTEANHG